MYYNLLGSTDWRRGLPASLGCPDAGLEEVAPANICDQRSLFIGPESDHWQCLSVTDSLTDCRLVNLIDVTLACEDTYSKLVEVVTVADVSDEDRVGNSLLQIWKLRFGHKA